MSQQKIVLFGDEEIYENLLPLTFTRPAAEFRMGITTLKEKWQAMLPGEYTYYVCWHLSERYPYDAAVDNEPDVLFVAGNILPDEKLCRRIAALGHDEALYDADGLVAFRGTKDRFDAVHSEKKEQPDIEVRRVKYVFDVFRYNADALREDFKRVAAGTEAARLSPTVTVIGDPVDEDGTPNIYIGENADVEGCILDLRGGPIYIGENATIQPGACVKGPVAVCANARIKTGASVYGGTTVGPYCKVGGEVDNTVMFGYSNKAHDGYLGNAVIGEWCNIGAGTNASNLKNDYSKIRIWNYRQARFMRTDLQFCGLIMGDHSKAGINCMFNTATVVGVGVNVHGCGYPRVFIPSFSEGSPEGGFSDVTLDKFMQIAGRVMARRGLSLTDVDHRMFERVYETAQRFK